MYLEFFGLQKPPFRITPDTHAFYEGSDRGATLHALCYAVEQGEGIIKVVGEVGTGKTMLCRMLPNKIRHRVDWVYLAHPSLSPEHTLHAIAKEMGLQVDTRTDRLSVMQLLHNELVKRHMDNRRVVILVEEAQGMPIDSLEEIRLLSNLETDEHKLMQIVLFGQPELDTKLSLRQIRQLKERITQNFYLQPLEGADIGEYLEFRLRRAGYTGPPLFTDAVVKEILKYSRGLVRRINILADKSMLSAFINERHTLVADDVENAAQENQYRAPSSWKFWKKASIACSLFTIFCLSATPPSTQHQQGLNFYGLKHNGACNGTPIKITALNRNGP